MKLRPVRFADVVNQRVDQKVSLKFKLWAALVFVLGLAGTVAVIWVIVHFVSKFW